MLWNIFQRGCSSGFRNTDAMNQNPSLTHSSKYVDQKVFKVKNYFDFFSGQWLERTEASVKTIQRLTGHVKVDVWLVSRHACFFFCFMCNNAVTASFCCSAKMMLMLTFNVMYSPVWLLNLPNGQKKYKWHDFNRSFSFVLSVRVHSAIWK